MALVDVVINPATRSDEVWLPDGSGGVIKLKRRLVYNLDDSYLTYEDAQGTPYLVEYVGEEAPSNPTYVFGNTSNFSADATLGDANLTTTDEIADVLSTLISDLKNRGVLNG